MLLVELAHNILMWARQWLGKHASRLHEFGIVRLIGQVWAIPGRVKLSDKEGVVRVRMRPQCQWHGHQAQHPRRVSVLLHPRQGGVAPLLWRNWPRREQRRACIQLLRHQRVEIQVQPDDATFTASPASLSRAERAHTRLTWQERLARNARVSTAGQVTIRLFGVPKSFATSLGLTRA